MRAAVALALLAAVALGGCATTYHKVIQGGHRYDWDSTRPPEEVARCIRGRVAAKRPWRATQRALDDRGAIEIVIGPGGEAVSAVAHLTPWRYGTKLEAWITSYAVLTRDTLHEQFFGSC